MVIKTIKSTKLTRVWELDDLAALPMLYAHSVRDVLFDLDAACSVSDLEDVGAVQFHPDHQEAWSVTITVNSIEPCGSVICDFYKGDCYNVDLKEYNP